MTRAIATLAALSLAACSPKSTPLVDFPDLPALPPSVTEACPPLALLSDSTLGGLVLADVVAAKDYAACQARQAAAVRAYDEARAKIAEARAKIPQ